MSDDLHMPELLALHALGATDGDERVQVEAHLVTCEECRSELAELTRDVALIGQGNVEAPPAALRGTVLNAIDEIAGAPAAAAVADEPVGADVLSLDRPERNRRRRFVMPALAAASIVLAFGVALQSVRVAELREELDDSKAQVVPIEGSGALADATIKVALRADSATPRLELANMPTPPRGKAWQAWSIDDDGTATSLGTIERDSRVAALSVDDDAAEVAVTLEPSGGSVQPTSDPIVRGAVQV